MTDTMTAPQRDALRIAADGGVFYRSGRPRALRRKDTPREDVFRRLHERGYIHDTGEPWEVSTLTFARLTPAGERAAMRYDARLEHPAVRETVATTAP